MKPKFVTIIWDWKDKFPVKELDKALARFNRPAVTEATTDGDWFALVVTERADAKKAQSFYNREWRAMAKAGAR